VTPAARAGRQSPAVRLVLFDIDGTLLWSDGAGRRAINRALADIFGETGPAEHRFDGKTDPQIVREMMRIAGRDDADIDRRMAPLFTRYVACLEEELRDPAHHAKPLPGVRELLDSLSQEPEVALGLLTGNLLDGARAKLRAVGIDPEMFIVGAFGSDHEHRPELPGIAQRRAKEALGLDIPGRHVVVIGDTPADVQCGRGIGARAIGVATGRYSPDELREHGAAAVFADLTDTEAVLMAILADS